MVAIQVLLRWAWPGQQTLVWDWANFAYYSAFFIGGFYVGRFESVANLIDEHRVVMTSIGLIAAAAMVPFFLRLVVVEDVSDWPGYLAYTSLSGLAGVGLVIGIAGWARRHFAGDGRLHTWARDRAFGVYLLHQPCVVLAAALVIGATWPIAVKFALTLVAATALTLALSEVLGRIDLLAPAFGRDRIPFGRVWQGSRENSRSPTTNSTA
jgi:peptidoglycan/LPS O-acetylase OafA/YrhL